MELILLIAVILFIVVKGRRVLEKWDLIQDHKRFLGEWKRLHDEEARLNTECETAWYAASAAIAESEPKRAELHLKERLLVLEERKIEAEITKLRIEIIKKDFDKEKRVLFCGNDGDSDYYIKYADMDGAQKRYKERIDWVESMEKQVKETEEENLFYQCKKCNEPYARERISNEWLNVEYLGSECELEDEDGFEQTVEDTESITKKEEQKGTERVYKVKMHKIYQCKYCNDKTDEIQDNKVWRGFFCCPECAEDDVIKEVGKEELGTFKSYKEVTETTSRGEKTKQVSITKVRERTDYECSNCGHKFSSINSRELR